MNFSDALEVLIIARPLIDGVKNKRAGWRPSKQEFEALEAIGQTLQEFDYNSELLNRAGWTSADLVFLQARLNYYYANFLTQI